MLLTPNGGLLQLNNSNDHNNINNKAAALASYFDLRQPTSNIKPKTPAFDWPETKKHVQNRTDSFPLTLNTNRYNESYSGRKNFSIRHNHSVQRKHKLLSNSIGIR